MTIRLCALIAGLLAMFLYAQCLRADSLALNSVKLPPGFSISLYASGVKNARGMVRGEKGTVFVGSRKEGRVYAVVDENGDQRADRVYTLAKGLELPVGVAYRNGALYVSALDRILRYDDIEKHLSDPPPPVVITDQLPKDQHHGWKYLAFGPDGKLYVAVGVPCNICEPDSARYGHIARMNPDGSGYEVVARGIRNSVGFDWDPSTKQLWFTDNGRDWLGDDQPPDELNHALKRGIALRLSVLPRERRYCRSGIWETTADAAHFVLPPSNSDRMSPHWACGFTRDRCFPPNIKAASLLPNMARGIAAKRSGIALRLPRRSKTGSGGTPVFAKGGCKASKHGDGRWTFCRCPMVRC